MSARSHPFRAVSALMVAAVLAPAGLIGVAGALSDSGPMRPVLAMLALAAIIGIGGSVRAFIDVLRASKDEGEQLRAAREALPTDGIPSEAPAGLRAHDGPPADAMSPTYDRPSADAFPPTHDGPMVLLGRWSIASDEAKLFAGREWSRRKREVPLVAAIIFVLGSALLWWSQGGPAWAAGAAGAFVAALYLMIGLGKYGMEYHAASRAGGDVVVWTTAVEALGTRHATDDLTSVNLTNDSLELGIRWQTRNGPATDTVVIPVPQHAWPIAADVARLLKARLPA